MTRDENLDPDLLMWNIRRRVRSATTLPRQNFVAAFHFLGVPAKRSRFWLLFKNGDVEICIRNPRYETGLTVTAHVRTLTQIWLGHVPLKRAIDTRQLLLEGDRAEVRAFSGWFNLSLLAIRDEQATLPGAP